MSNKKNIAIVCNRLAGAGRAVSFSKKIADEAASRGVSYTLFIDNWPGDFLSFSDVWIVGGDGTLNFFINKYPGINLPLVIFNGGTGNDVHWLMFKEKSFEEQMEIAIYGEPRPVDAGRCNEKYFLNGVGIGLEGAVAKNLTGKKKKPGKASFMGAILRKIFFYQSKEYHVQLDENSLHRHCLLISVMNGHRAGGGFHVAPTSAIDDGLLDVVIVDKLHPFLRVRWLPVIEKGNHLALPFVRHFRVRKTIITSPTTIDAHLDGEYYSANRLEIEILPGKYHFRY
jgi:diacylglycerol kinase (ATP)